MLLELATSEATPSGQMLYSLGFRSRVMLRTNVSGKTKNTEHRRREGLLAAKVKVVTKYLRLHQFHDQQTGGNGTECRGHSSARNEWIYQRARAGRFVAHVASLTGCCQAKRSDTGRPHRICWRYSSRSISREIVQLPLDRPAATPCASAMSDTFSSGAFAKDARLRLDAWPVPLGAP